jgi:hypothetical protein
MVSALENGVKGGRWYSLMDKVYAPDTLEAAWNKVRVNDGAAVEDGQSLERFAAQEERRQNATAGNPDGQGSRRPDGGEARARADL